MSEKSTGEVAKDEVVFAHENREVWQEAIDLAKNVYRITDSFPNHELFGLTGQLRRAAVSVSCNIAEGKGRHHPKEFVQFLYVARGSLYETLALLRLSSELGFLSGEGHSALRGKSAVIGRKLNGLINSLKK